MATHKTIPITKAVEIAAEMHRAGQYQRAEAMYREILRQDPGNVDAVHLLGVLANQGGRPDIAEELISRALSRRPGEPLIHFNYAEALSNLGRPGDAAEHYRRALAGNPDYVEALSGLSKVLVELGQTEEALAAGDRAVELSPDNALALNNLGNAYRTLGRDADAIPRYQAAVRADPRFAEALNNLGLALTAVGHFKEGVEALRESIRLNPTLSDAHNNLAVVLNNAGQHADAVAEFETAIKLDEENAEARNNLGACFRSMGRHADSLDEIGKAIRLRPKAWAFRLNLAQTLKDVGRAEEALAEADVYLENSPGSAYGHFLRGIVLRDLSRPDEAIGAFRESLRLKPGAAEVQATLGYALQERGELDEALEMLNASIAQQADPQTHSNVMMVMCYHPAVTPRALYEAHRAYARVHEDPVRERWPAHANTRDPGRKIRVGYFSPDLRGHVVSYFSNPIFENHDHSGFEVYAYSHNFAADGTTLMQRATFDRWRETAGMSPDKIAAMIREDQIDILVELAGHTANNGLPVLARKPAPIQINGIGFPSTTGLSAVDYRITDRLCDPPGIAEAYNSERLLYLPDCFWCYQPHSPSPEVGPLPADRDGHVTFVSVNNFTKVTNQVLETWARILARVPGSRIILQTSGLASQFVQDRVRAIFAARGVGADRVDMRRPIPMYDYLKLIESCDVMLDPFPFNGGTTTCHGLWMGTPVVSLEGKTHAGRMGLSMLTCIGLPELCAPTEEAYVDVAVALAGDLPRLRQIRAGMRDRLRASPLLDGPRYVRNLEAAYRRIWAEWCAATTR